MTHLQQVISRNVARLLPTNIKQVDNVLQIILSKLMFDSLINMQILFWTSNHFFFLLNRNTEVLFNFISIIYESILSYNMLEDIRVSELEKSIVMLFLSIINRFNCSPHLFIVYSDSISYPNYS